MHQDHSWNAKVPPSIPKAPLKEPLGLTEGRFRADIKQEWSGNYKVSALILPPFRNKVQIGLNQALFGPYVGMGVV